MNRVSIVSDSADRDRASKLVLGKTFEIRFIGLQDLAEVEPEEFTVVDVNLSSTNNFSALKHFLKRRPERSRIVLAVDRGDSQQALHAFALGATDIVERPFDAGTLLKRLMGDIESLAGDVSDYSRGIAAGVGALQCIFASASFGTPLEPKEIAAAGDAVLSHVEADGLGRWITAVRRHHSQTFQHCLIVTGVAVTFGRHLGFSDADRKRLSTAGLLHDIGKAGIPVDILEKPGALDDDELAVMKRHPLMGYEALKSVDGITAEILDVVTHHHEYLDGSGYPHGLGASELSDIVRLMTVADIFGALIERRSYKPPMSGPRAYEILVEMGSKLDVDIVRAFKPISAIQF